MIEEVELREIRTFLALADELHFGRTADRLHLTPSRVSQVLRSLEARVGGRLFERTSRTVRLTRRQRDTTNRRIHVVELTDAGEETFLRLRTAAVSFGQRLRAGISNKEVASFEGVLDRLIRNVAPNDEPRQWTGF
jgi:DNA-binding transcriptional LysR family regulator